MNAKRVTPHVVVALVLIGAVCIGLRFQARRDIRMGLADTMWRLTYSIECEAESVGAKLRAAIPSDTPHSRLFRQDFRNSGLRIERPHSPSSETREVVAVAERGDECRLTLRFDLQLSPRATWPADEVRVSLTGEALAKYLGSDNGVEVDSQFVAETLGRLRQGPGDRVELVERLFEYCQKGIVAGGNDAPNGAEEALREGLASPLGRARTMVALCRAGRIPSRVVAGFEIKQRSRTAPHVWVEVLIDEHWIPYDPVGGFSHRLPYNFVPTRRGDARILLSSGMSEVESRFSVVQLPGAPQGAASPTRHPVDVLNLTRLPLEMHPVLSLILLMPLGALVTCVFRNIVGIQTSGTFTPTLLALSFVFADWRTGVVVLVAVVILGFTTRNLLDRLKLLMLPRLSIILTLVVCCIVFGVSLLDYFRLTPGAQAVLLPMVILTMIVERFHVTAQEDGMYVAVQRLVGTTFVGFFCFLVLRWETVARLLLVYPEAHLFTVAVLIVIGRYTGYQLLEQWRFRDAVEVER